MAAPSKLWNRCTCYELGHCWSPTCLGATFSIARAATQYSLKLYAVFYLISHLYGLHQGRPFSITRVLAYLRDVIQSTSFLSVNVSLVIASFCFFRHLLGGFYPGFGFIACFPACVIAILLERKGRRGMLALYTMNLAMEVVFNMLVQRGHVTPVRYGEVLLYAISSAVLFLMFRMGNCLSKDAQSALRLLVGGCELPASQQESSQDREQPSSQSTSSQEAPNFTQFLPKQLQLLITNFIKRLQDRSKHSLCLHQFSCAYYSTEAFARRFFLGYTIQGFINVLKALPSLVRKPSTLIKALYHKDNFSLGLFLGFYSGLFRSLNCLLRWLRNKDNPLHGFLAGFVAGLSAIFYRSKTISLYVLSKVAENVFFKMQDLKYLPYIPHGDILLYAIGTSIVLQAAVFEPHNIRPAYWRFLLGLTGNKFALMNRKLLDIHGTQASKLYPDYWPHYDTRFTPNLIAAGLV
ncbi:transmembrane protein 135-like [Diadema setosum]|uniref:transmembrane protein 135-like n=1 Tax=Diadema setosum TaxID=31175 RepID=UPI003B3AE926